jgi:O-antigen/teichoic acid export membrane protein
LKIWTKLLRSKNFQSTFLYTLTSFINQFGNLLVLPFVWKGLSIEDFAVIGLVEAATPFLACILTLSSEQYLTRFYYGWEVKERPTQIGRNLTLNFISVFLLGIISFAILSTVSLIRPFDEAQYYQYGLVHIIFFSTFAFPSALFRITNNTYAYIVFTLGLFFVRLILNYVFTITFGLGLYGFIISTTITSFSFFLILYLYLFYKYHFIFSGPFFKEALKFSLPFVPTNLMASIANLMDRVVLSVYGGKFEAGLLTLGQKVASIIGSLSQALKLGYVPYITEYFNREQHSVAEFNKYRMFYLTPISVLSFAIMLFGVELLNLIGIDIKQAGNYLYLLLLIVYLNSNNLFFSPGLYLSKRSDKMWIPNFIQLLARVILYYVFVPILILKGVILASLLASLIAFVYNYILSEKYFRLNLSVLSIGVQFLPFLITLGLSIVGIDILELELTVKLLIMIFYLVILWFFLLNKYDKPRTQIT